MNELRSKMFITVSELADIMRFSKSFAYEYLKGNECPFPVYKAGSKLVIPCVAFFKWYDEFEEHVMVMEEH